MKTVLDLNGLKCPLPILRTHKALKPLPKGAEVIVLSDDGKSPTDFTAYCARNSVELLAMDETDKGYEFRLRKR